VVLLALVLLLAQSPAPPCGDLTSCRQAALEARERKDYEAFHDLAWITYRKGKPDDPELMLLLARAQSLSGRAGDAIVMLERLAARGAATDVETSDDFDAVRHHPRWKSSSSGTGAEAPKAPVTEPVKAPKAEVAKAPAGEATKAPTGAAAKAPAGEAAKAPTREATKGTLTFTTLLSPSALAYDAVSKRYLIADRQARRIAVIDERSGTVSTLVGEKARLGEIGGMAIDPRQGDLWVVTSSGDDTSLSRLQLISGRELGVVRLKGVRGRVGGVAFVRGTGLVTSDEHGDIYKVSPSGQAEKIGSLEYVPAALGADGDGLLYVTAGGPRIARYRIAPFRRLGVVDVGGPPPSNLPFAVVRDSIHVVVATEAGYEIRTLRK
jgi:hypothetical protein